MTRRIRSNVIIRRFLAGMSFNDLRWEYRDRGLTLTDIERAIRNALNRKRSKR